jgi:hypothetical protein
MQANADRDNERSDRCHNPYQVHGQDSGSGVVGFRPLRRRGLRQLPGRSLPRSIRIVGFASLACQPPSLSASIAESDRAILPQDHDPSSDGLQTNQVGRVRIGLHNRQSGTASHRLG